MGKWIVLGLSKKASAPRADESGSGLRVAVDARKTCALVAATRYEARYPLAMLHEVPAEGESLASPGRPPVVEQGAAQGNLFPLLAASCKEVGGLRFVEKKARNAPELQGS